MATTTTQKIYSDLHLLFKPVEFVLWFRSFQVVESLPFTDSMPASYTPSLGADSIGTPTNTLRS
jgi:hypothetical protein